MRKFVFVAPLLILTACAAVLLAEDKADANKNLFQQYMEKYGPPGPEHKLLEPLANVPPKPATRWRANFYRVDYDDGRESSWDWARVGPSFHEYEKFGTLIFD